MYCISLSNYPRLQTNKIFSTNFIVHILYIFSTTFHCHYYKFQYSPLNAGLVSPQAALMQAASQGYISPIAGLPISSGLTTPAVSSASEPTLQPSLALSSKYEYSVNIKSYTHDNLSEESFSLDVHTPTGLI